MPRVDPSDSVALEEQRRTTTSDDMGEQKRKADAVKRRAREDWEKVSELAPALLIGILANPNTTADHYNGEIVRGAFLLAESFVAEFRRREAELVTP